MAKNNFSLNFDGFIDYAKQIGELGDDALKLAVDNAFSKSKEYVNDEVKKAMDASKYNFDGTVSATMAIIALPLMAILFVKKS